MAERFQLCKNAAKAEITLWASIISTDKSIFSSASDAKLNGEANQKEEEKAAEERGVKLKNQSVLQAKLTKLAIQIGYAGKTHETNWQLTSLY